MLSNNVNTNLQISNILNKIPKTLLFNELPDRLQANNYIKYVHANIPESKNINQEQLFRAIIAYELRVVSMKTIEPEILLIVALNNITLDDFTCNSDILVKKVISQNKEKYDLDTMQRVMAQIMTKLPRYLSARVCGKQKLQIFQLLAKFNNISDKLLEQFISYDPSIYSNNSNNSNNSTANNTSNNVANKLVLTMDLNKGDYDTLDRAYLDEINTLEKQGKYVSNDDLEFSKVVKYQLKNRNTLNNSSTNCNTDGNLNASYIDFTPDLIKGVDDKLYYYDRHSGVLTDLPHDSIDATPVSLGELKTILKGRKIDKMQLYRLIRELKSTPNANQVNSQINNDNTDQIIKHEKDKQIGIFEYIYNIFEYIYNMIFAKHNKSPINTSVNDDDYLRKLYNTKYNRRDRRDRRDWRYLGKRCGPKFFNSTCPNNATCDASGHCILSRKISANLPTVASPMPTNASSMPTNASSMPTNTSYMPTNTSFMPTVTSPMPTVASSMPTFASPMPTVTSPMPTVTSPLPSSKFQNIEGFSSNLSKEEENLLKKINKNNDVEITATGFVVVLILIFLVVMLIGYENAK